MKSVFLLTNHSQTTQLKQLFFNKNEIVKYFIFFFKSYILFSTIFHIDVLRKLSSIFS